MLYSSGDFLVTVTSFTSGTQARSDSASRQPVPQGRAERQRPERCPGDPAAEAACLRSPPEQSSRGGSDHDGTQRAQALKGLDSAEKVKERAKEANLELPREENRIGGFAGTSCRAKAPCSVREVRRWVVAPGAQPANGLCLFSQSCSHSCSVSVPIFDSHLHLQPVGQRPPCLSVLHRPAALQAFCSTYKLTPFGFTSLWWSWELYFIND